MFSGMLDLSGSVLARALPPLLASAAMLVLGLWLGAIWRQRRLARELNAVRRAAGGSAHDDHDLLTVISGYGMLHQQRIAAADPIRVGSETILLVEDEAEVRFLARRVLEERGYRVLAAACPSEALRIAGQYPGPIPLLVTDVALPELSGGELAESLMTLRPEMRSLFLSGSAHDASPRRSVPPAGAAFLQSPFSPDVLISKVREALDAARLSV